MELAKINQIHRDLDGLLTLLNHLPTMQVLSNRTRVEINDTDGKNLTGQKNKNKKFQY